MVRGAEEVKVAEGRAFCVICHCAVTDERCGDWCEECEGLPMCGSCQAEHRDDVAQDRGDQQ